RPFVSRGLSGHGFSAPTDTLRRRSLTPADSPVAATGNGEGARSHKVQFFSDDESFLVGFTRFIAGALRAGSAVVVVATESHRSSLFQRLQAQGLNIGASIEQGRYIPLDVSDTLSTFMVDDLPDSVRFRKIASDLVAGAAKAALGKSPRVAACGECAPFLWARGNADAAIRVEHLWDEMAKAFDRKRQRKYTIDRLTNVLAASCLTAAHRTRASGCVPTGPTTHARIAYCDKVMLKPERGGSDEAQTLSRKTTLTPCGVQEASQPPNDCADPTTSGQERL